MPALRPIPRDERVLYFWFRWLLFYERSKNMSSQVDHFITLVYKRWHLTDRSGLGPVLNESPCVDLSPMHGLIYGPCSRELLDPATRPAFLRELWALFYKEYLRCLKNKLH